MKNRLARLYATALYLGLIPGIPGTYASVATTLSYYLIWKFGHGIVPSLHLSAVCIIAALGVFAAAAVSRDTGLEDPRIVVIDEVAGQLLTFLFLPVGVFNLVAGTLFFRIFDIWKPFPIKRLEPLRNGVGIMADDLLAGVYANLVLQLLGRILHR